MCIDKFIPSKKKRILGVGNALYLENSSSSRFSRQIINKKKGKEKVLVEDFQRVTKENAELKQKIETFMEKFEVGYYVEKDPSNRLSTSREPRTSSRGSSPTNEQD